MPDMHYVTLKGNIKEVFANDEATCFHGFKMDRRKAIPPPKQQTWVVPFQNESDRADGGRKSSTSEDTLPIYLMRTKSTIWVLSIIIFGGFTLIKCFECIHWYMDMPTYIHKR